MGSMFDTVTTDIVLHFGKRYVPVKIFEKLATMKILHLQLFRVSFAYYTVDTFLQGINFGS